ncbi:ABC transporter permease subunit [bacterium]|nr:ABC transporter permease subunit [bacterium]
MRLIRSIAADASGLWGLSVVGIALVMALFAYVLATDSSENANTIVPSIALRPPGFEVDLLEIQPAPCGGLRRLWKGCPNAAQIVPVQASEPMAEGLRYRPMGAPPNEWRIVEAGTPYRIVHRRFWMGTDRFGRDLFSRLLIGARVSLSVGFVAVALSLIIGLPLGAWAGFKGGGTDAWISGLIQVVWSLPGLMLVIAVTLALGKGFWQVFVAVGLSMWVEVARIVRGEVLAEKQKEYVEAARVMGFGDARILFRHIVPNVSAPLIVVSAANFASAILIESGLSFLGLGARPPIPTWGGIIKDHYAYLMMGKGWLALWPGLCLMLVVLAFMMLGNRLRDVLDVRNTPSAS